MLYESSEVTELIEKFAMKYIRQTEQLVAIKAQSAAELHEIRHTAGKLIGAGEVLSGLLQEFKNRESNENVD